MKYQVKCTYLKLFSLVMYAKPLCDMCHYFVSTCGYLVSTCGYLVSTCDYFVLTR